LHRESVEADRATPRDAASADGPAPHAGKSPLTEVFANAARHALAAEMATPARAGFIHSHSLGEDEMQDETKQEDPREKLQSVKRDYFPPSDLEKAQTAVGAVLEICQAVKIAPVYNFDVNADFPDGYGLAVLPIKSRDATRGNVVTGMAIVALPDPNTVAEHDKGADYIRAAVIDSFLAKAANAVRPRSDGSTAASVPYTVEDFITSQKTAESLAAFRELAKGYVKALKKKGLSIMTPAILRQILSSAQFAEQQFPHIAKEKWSGLLDKMIAKAQAKGLDVGIMDFWKQTRETVDVKMGDFELDALDGLMDDA
jgi:hypothetical protein